MLDANQIKVVFFDIDETLYHKEKRYIPTSTMNALKQLKANGIIPAIATGRSLCALPQQVEQLITQLPIDLIVSINGQFNSYQGKIVQSYPLAINDIQRITHFFNEHHIDYAFIATDHVAVNRATQSIDDALRPITDRYIIDPDYYQQYPVYQMLAFYDNTKDDFIQQSDLLQQHLRVVRWHPYSVDLLAKEGSKARGIDAVLTHLGLKPENAVAFGDGLNDIEMMQSVGFGVAMGNGHPTMQAVANYITDDIEQDGIAKALQKLGLI